MQHANRFTSSYAGALLAALLAAASHQPAAASAKNLPCGEVSEPALFAAITKSYEAFASNWLIIGEDWFSSYTVKLEDKNPLLPNKEPARRVSGFVWTKDVRCTAAVRQKDKSWTVRITGRHIKFNEEAGGWIKAVKKGTLAQYQYDKEDGRWTVKDQTAEASVLGGDDAERRPRPEDLPSRQLKRKRRT